MSIADYSKFAISLILASYFVNIHHLSVTEAFCKIKERLISCSKIKNLEPSIAYFNSLPVINSNIKVIGIVTAVDILRAIRHGKNLDSIQP
ncbi:MAG: CBS domain-containing protein [Candidatus Nitrosopolaris sp.]